MSLAVPGEIQLARDVFLWLNRVKSYIKSGGLVNSWSLAGSRLQGNGPRKSALTILADTRHAHAC